jgi:hypothetical protein
MFGQGRRPMPRRCHRPRSCPCRPRYLPRHSRQGCSTFPGTPRLPVIRTDPAILYRTPRSCVLFPVGALAHCRLAWACCCVSASPMLRVAGQAAAPEETGVSAHVALRLAPPPFLGSRLSASDACLAQRAHHHVQTGASKGVPSMRPRQCRKPGKAEGYGMGWNQMRQTDRRRRHHGHRGEKRMEPPLQS